MSEGKWCKFLKSQAGVAMIEFAVALPILILMLFGTVELTRYILINQKLDKATNTLDDLATRMIAVDDASMNQFTDAMPKFLRPFNFGTSDVRVVFTFVRREPAATLNQKPPPAKVTRQYSKTPGAVGLSKIGAVGANANMPNGFQLKPGENTIVVESFYRFKSILGDSFLPSRELYKVAVMRPRIEQSFCPTGCRQPGDNTPPPTGCFVRPICAPPPCTLTCPPQHTQHPPGCDLNNCACPGCIQPGQEDDLPPSCNGVVPPFCCPSCLHSYDPPPHPSCGTSIPDCPCPSCQNPNRPPDAHCPGLPLCCKSCYFPGETRPPGCESKPECPTHCPKCPNNVDYCPGTPPDDCHCESCPHQ